MPRLLISCPHCHKSIKASSKLIGTTATCPSCNGQILITDPDQNEPDPVWTNIDLPTPATTSLAPATIKCPFCAEDILADAKKCKHCGEWLNQASSRPGTAFGERGTADARAVTRGIKQKELDEQLMGCFGVIAVALAIGLGALTQSYIVAFVTFFLLCGIISAWYYKE